MHCPGGNATDPIWRVLASSNGISCWTSLKPQQSNPNPNSLANQLWCIDFLTPPTPLIIPHRLPAFLESYHVFLPAWISLTLSRHFSLSFIVFGRCSGLHPVSSHSYCIYVQAGHPAFAQPYVGVHRSTSLMSSSLLLQQCPACLVCLTWIVFMMGGRWPYSWCFVGCCLQDLFSIARNILVYTRISYATQKLDSCKMVKKQSEAFHMFLWHFFQV